MQRFISSPIISFHSEENFTLLTKVYPDKIVCEQQVLSIYTNI